MKFIRVSTRLYCDIYEAFRSLSKSARLEKHFQKQDNTLILGDEPFEIESIVEEPYFKVIWNFNNPAVSFTFNIMKCASKTEYCTEIHLVIRENNEDVMEQINDHYRLTGNTVLEILRKNYNKDWVILDSDLHLSQFRGSF